MATEKTKRTETKSTKYKTPKTDRKIEKFKKSIYLYAFCEGLLFWYAIEKLFMQSIGLSLATIVIIGLIAQTGRMVFEIPSSVLADRWNRRNTLVVGTVVMIAASALLPLAQTAWQYVAFVLLWTVYYAFKSGTDTAFIFDSLKGHKAEKQFQHVLARYHSWEYIGLIISGLTAGLIAAATNLQAPFWLSIIPLTIGGILLLRLPEPRVTEPEEPSKWWNHAVHAWKEIKSKALIWVTALSAMLLALQFIWYEYYQLYGLAVHTPEVWFGGVMSALCLGLIAGAEITRRVAISKKIITIFWLVIATTHLAGFIVGNFVSLLVVIFVTMTAVEVLYLSFTNTINHQIGSSKRATVISLAGSASQVLFLGLALLFRFATDRWSIQTAFVVASLPLLLLALVDVISRISWLNPKLPVDKEPFAKLGAIENDVR